MSKSFKKKKYNARFPPARIKKIMQTDEEVGKVAAAVPVIISRALEMFIESLVTETSKLTIAKNAKTMSTSHIKQTIKGTKQFDFLRDVVKNVPDHQAEDNGDGTEYGETSMAKRKGRVSKSDGIEGRKRSTTTKKASSDEYEEEDDEEDTESDDESTSTSRTSFESVPSSSHMAVPGTRITHTQPLPHQPFPSPFNAMNIPNSNIVSPAQGSASQGTLHVRDALISGQDMGQIPIVNFPVVNNIFVHPAVASPILQMPLNLTAGLPALSPLSPAFLQSQMTQALKPQPVDLTHASKKNTAAEDDDYDT